MGAKGLLKDALGEKRQARKINELGGCEREWVFVRAVYSVDVEEKADGEDGMSPSSRKAGSVMSNRSIALEM